MRRLRKLLSLAVVCLIGGWVQVDTARAFEFSYFTCFQIQNLSGSTANISISYLDSGGVEAASALDTISAAASKTYCPIHPTAGFDGSVIVSSDQAVAAVTNVLGDMGVAAAAYSGAQSGSTSVFLPLLFKNNVGYNTWVSVQNAGGSLANVQIDYSDGTSANATIPLGASAKFDQSTETHTQAVFAGTITSDQPVAAVVIEEDPDIMFAYTGFQGGSTNPVMPLINMNNDNYITGVQIQNTGSSASNITVSYTPSLAGTACSEQQTIPAGDSRTFALFVFNEPPGAGITTDCILGEQFVGSAKVTANSASQDLVVVVNQLKNGVNGEAYGGFDPDSATSTVVMPLIMDRNDGWFTGFSVQNVGSVMTTVNCTFTGTSYSASATLNPGEALTEVQLGAIADGYVGSGTCTAGTGGKIAAIVNELRINDDDNLMVYEGISVP